MEEIMKYKNRKLKGFTLIELIVVIAIIALLASLALPQYNKAKLSAVVTAHNANVQTIKSAALLADTQSSSESVVLNSEVLQYIEGGKLPELSKEIPGDSPGWDIKKDESGNIIVTPGLMKLENGKIVPK